MGISNILSYLVVAAPPSQVFLHFSLHGISTQASHVAPGISLKHPISEIRVKGGSMLSMPK
jgi:hypothetical protein